MLIEPYRADELRFAWCYRLFLRWQTHRRERRAALAELDRAAVDAIGSQYEIRPLEFRASDTDVQLLLSLKPEETVSACVGKWKGQLSRWLRERLGLTRPANLLSRGYFAITTGNSTRDEVEAYLSKQGEHHGYADRPRPPVFVRRYELTLRDEERLRTKHAHTLLQHHLVLATPGRRGVFVAAAGEAVAERWRALLREAQAALVKVSFVPDHVHAAVRVHPGRSPAELIVQMMNAAQELMFKEFEENVIRGRAARLWQPSAYLGSYGQLSSPQVSRYMQAWEREV